MVSLKVSAAHGRFFDRPEIIKRVGKTKVRVLSRFGAFVRRAARSSIRKRKKASQPGKPPTNRTGKLKNFIYFAYDPESGGVVIGPAKLNAVASETALVALERGGPTTIIDAAYRRGSGPNARLQRVRRRVTIDARPFMGPALQQEAPKLPGMWKDAIR